MVNTESNKINYFLFSILPELTEFHDNLFPWHVLLHDVDVSIELKAKLIPHVFCLIMLRLIYRVATKMKKT